MADELLPTLRVTTLTFAYTSNTYGTRIVCGDDVKGGSERGRPAALVAAALGLRERSTGRR